MLHGPLAKDSPECDLGRARSTESERHLELGLGMLMALPIRKNLHRKESAPFL